MNDDSKISSPDAGDEAVAGTYKESAAAPADVHVALDMRIMAAIAGPLGHTPENHYRPHKPLATEPFCESDDETYPCGPLSAAVAEVMEIVDNLAAELRAMTGAALESRADVKRELATARSEADRANRLLSRLHAEKQHQDSDLRVRIRSAIEEAYGGVAGAGERLDTATDAVTATVFPALGSAWTAVQERDEVLAKTREELAAVKAQLPETNAVEVTRPPEWRPTLDEIVTGKSRSDDEPDPVGMYAGQLRGTARIRVPENWIETLPRNGHYVNPSMYRYVDVDTLRPVPSAEEAS